MEIAVAKRAFVNFFRDFYLCQIDVPLGLLVPREQLPLSVSCLARFLKVPIAHARIFLKERVATELFRLRL